MTVFWVLLGIGVLCGVAVVAAGRGDGLAPTDPDRPDVSLPDNRPAGRDDVDRLRFSVGFRGYRMDEVDDVLDRLAADIAVRDGQISRLEELLGPAAPATADDERSGEPAEDRGEAAVEGAAFVPPVDAASDATTARTLLVPLDQFVSDHAETEPDD